MDRSKKVSKDLLLISRIAIFVFFVYVLAGINLQNLGFHDPPPLRYLHATLLLSLLALTFLGKFQKQRIDSILFLSFLTITTHSFLLLYLNHLFVGYLVGVLLVLSLVSLSLINKKILILFFAYVILLGIFVGVFVTDPQIPLPLYYSSIITPVIVSYLALRVRLNAIELLIQREKELDEFHFRISFDLEKARGIQMHLIEDQFPQKENWSFHSYYKPYESIGGDLISCCQTSENTYSILFADVAGHGISAAMVSSMVILAFRESTNKKLSPKEILYLLEEKLKDLVENVPVSAILLQYNLDTNVVRYSYAGHHPILLKKPNQEFQELAGKGSLMLSYFPPVFHDHEYTLEKGDVLLLYSDGIGDSLNSKNQVFGSEGILNAWRKFPKKTGLDLIQEICIESIKFSSGTIADDITALLIETN